MPRLPLLAALVALLAACASGPAGGGLRVDLDKANEERLLRYYLGGYAAPAGADPFEAGLVAREGGGFVLRPEAFPEAARAALRDADADGTLGWDEFTVFVEATYADARGLPASLDALRAARPWSLGDSAWFGFDVEGSAMTQARRRTLVPTAALRAALAGFRAAGDRLVYPEGTLLVGEHLVDGAVVETTVKRRRADGFWDFAVYGADGRRAAATATEPKPLRAPVQCVGCHLGERRFEPDASFPAAAPDGPYGPRALVVPDAWRRPDVAARFNEHAARTDGVLGLYATVYVGRRLAERAAGTISARDAALLDRLGL